MGFGNPFKKNKPKKEFDLNSELKKIWPEWEIVALIGEGSYGKVYEIIRKENGKTFKQALKVIKIPQSQADVDYVSESMSEQNVTDYFYHMVQDITKEFGFMDELRGKTNIVNYVDHKVISYHNELRWDIYIRMELLTSLREYSLKNEMTQGRVINMGIDICKALELCGKRSIIHRDIKPENIFVAEDILENGKKETTYKIGDFGIARKMSNLTGAMSKIGTEDYMAPEIYNGEQKYGIKVDIYSLGIVMYRYLNGRRMPFLPLDKESITPHDRSTALLKRMSGREAIPPPKNASEELSLIVLKACSFDPDDRFNTPADMREALENICLSGTKPVGTDLFEIRVTGAYRKDYFVGESFNPEGLIVTAVFDNGDQAVINEYTISPQTALSVADLFVTVSYSAGVIVRKNDIAINVREIQLQEIEVTGNYKTSYLAGEEFDPVGMQVTAIYNNGQSKEVSNFEYLPYGPLTEADQTITVSYCEDNIEKTRQIPVKTELLLNNIELNSTSFKCEYYEGEKIDLSGLVVSAVYCDGSRKEITDYKVSLAGKLLPEHNRITISYAQNGIEKSQDIRINVQQRIFEDIVLSGECKTVYQEGELFDPQGLQVLALYNSGEKVAVSNYNIFPSGQLTGENTSVAITYQEGNVQKQALVDIQVIPGTAEIIPPRYVKLQSIKYSGTFKTEYQPGEMFDPQGLIVKACYSNNHEETIYKYSYEPRRVLALNDKKITITYSEDRNKEDSGTESLLDYKRRDNQITVTAEIPITVKAAEQKKKSIKPLPIIIAAAAAVVIAAVLIIYFCGGLGQTTATKDVAVTQIVATETAINLYSGQTEDLAFSVLPAEAADSNYKAEWSSSNEKVAVVNKKGEVTAVAEGDAVITVKIGEVTAEFDIHVTNVTLTMNYATLDLFVGRSETLTYKLAPKEASAEKYKVKWSSSDKKIAAVDNNGKVTGVAEGKATVTLKVGEITAKCVVSVSSTDWSEWLESLPSGVSSAKYVVEEKTQYRYRTKSTKTSSSDSLSGWTLEDKESHNGDYGSWSSWSSDSVSESDTRQVETKTQYRYRDLETTTSSSSSLDGWTLLDATPVAYGDWSEWQDEPVYGGDGIQVQKQQVEESSVDENGNTVTSTKTQYRYRSVEYEYNYYRYGDWSSWSDTEVSATDSRETDSRTVYRYRERQVTYTYYYYKWSSWSNWSDSSVSQTSDTDVETRTVYRYKEK